jgi:Methyltransferase domain
MATVVQSRKTFIPAMGVEWLLPLYDPFTKLVGLDRWRRELIDQAALQPFHRVLDVGCGTGSLAVLVKQRHPTVEVVGLDPDAKALARATRKAHRAGVAIQLDRGFADALGHPAASFDRVFSSFMFHHLERADRPTEFVCVHNLSFACVMSKRAVAGINVSLAVRVHTAARSMSDWSRVTGLSFNCIGGTSGITMVASEIQTSRHTETACSSGLRSTTSTRPLHAPRVWWLRLSCHATAILQTATAVRTIGKSGCVIPTATRSFSRARTVQRMAIGDLSRSSVEVSLWCRPSGLRPTALTRAAGTPGPTFRFTLPHRGDRRGQLDISQGPERRA